MKIDILHQHFLKCDSISTDTRKVTKNSMFFALKGENFDGNQFAKDALKNGAKFAVIDDEQYKIDKRYILVNNVLKTLQELSTVHRNYLKTPIIAVTGSNGKTTTKELINAVLKTQYKTTATIGNLNNHIGVSLTLLSMNSETEIGIVEMGANHQKEIELLCSIALPDFGYITNFGKAHLEGFGGVEGVIKGKSELYTFLKENEKIIFVNANDKKQLEIVGGYKKVVRYGDKNTDVSIKLLRTNPFIELEFDDITVSSQLIGSYNFTNICASILIGKYFKIETDQIKIAIENYIPSNNRSQIINRQSTKIILDAYNANPTSMKAALENLSLLSDDRKCAILGDMFELGDDSKNEHEAIIHLVSKLNLESTYCIGENFYKLIEEHKSINYFKTLEDFKSQVNPRVFNNCIVLIKGSRGMALERILKWI